MTAMILLLRQECCLVPHSAIISTEGRIVDLRFLSGPKELVEPAMKAIRQWVYKPYLLDGKPVEVRTDIRVNFVLR